MGGEGTDVLVVVGRWGQSCEERLGGMGVDEGVYVEGTELV